MLTTENIVRCGRCSCILTEHELDNQANDYRWRCHACDGTPVDLTTWLQYGTIPSPSKDESGAEWVRRVRLASWHREDHAYASREVARRLSLN